jgi:hypothetical protein
MRDHLTILEDIERYLAENGLDQDLKELQDEARAAATGS